MKIKHLIEKIESPDAQLICMQDDEGNVLYIGNVTELAVYLVTKNPKALDARVEGMYVECYGAYYGQAGLTVVI